MRKQKELTKAQKLKLRAKESALKFRRELKKSTITAIIAAFGFLIALTWRDVITEWVTKISESSPFKNSLITAIIVTLISVIGIVIISNWDHEKQE
jgi:uncharacterized membrane protein